jgi:putative SOS response-associated peptidase YedK
MPVILEKGDWAAWLDPGNSDRLDIDALMRPADDDVIVWRRVSTRVNSVRNNDPTLLDPIT